MANIAETVKKQTDRILRQRALNRTEGVVVSGVSSGTGAPAPTVNNPPVDLTAHKTSGDHDGRYYTKTQFNNIIAALTFADVVRQAFDNTDTIEVVHNMGRRPMVQVQGSAVSDYGTGLYGAGAYGGILPYTVLAPSSIEHSLDSNKVAITLASDYTGEVICVG